MSTTYKEDLLAAERLLADRSDAPRLDSERIMLDCLQRNESAWIYAHANDDVPADIHKEFLRKVQLREQGLPLAYILGFQEFFGRRFKVNRHVLIPRPATEELVESALVIIKRLVSRLGRSIRVADIGTGSGCVAITLALEAGAVVDYIVATDISTAALKVAALNAGTLGAAAKVVFIEGNGVAALPKEEVDLIVSNPPYIPTQELDRALMSSKPEERGLKYEPRLALDGGANGQDIIETLRHIQTPVVYETTGGDIVRLRTE